MEGRIMVERRHEKRIARTYFRELFAALALYTILLFAAIKFGRPMAPGLLRTIVLASPMTAGFPRLSMFSVWCVLCLSVAVVQLLRKLLDR
jgi:hypothetical protein